MTPDFRALCAELVELSTPVDSISQLAERLQKLNALADCARALLAEAVAEGPTNEELDQLLTEIDQGGEALSWRVFARAVLARWGRPAAAPVPEPGEVEELLATAGVFKGSHGIEGLLNADTFWEQQPYGTRLYYEDGIADYLHRGVLRSAATLLQQQAAPVPAVAPVPVSERWPEFSDCDAAERVWCWSWALETWRLSRIKQSIHTHWLPANALPLPAPEVQL